MTAYCDDSGEDGRLDPAPANSERGAAAPAPPGRPVVAAAEATGGETPPARGGAPAGGNAHLRADASGEGEGEPRQMTPQMTPEAPARPRGRPFPPGVSGNPSGRPRDPPELVEAARAHTAEAVTTIVDVMRNAKRLSTRLRAAELLLDRAWGRAPLAVSLELRRRVDVADVTAAEWEALALLRHNVRPALPAADRVVEIETEEAPCSTETD